MTPSVPAVSPTGVNLPLYAGNWAGHGRGLTIYANGDGEMRWREYNPCPGTDMYDADYYDATEPCDPPGGVVRFRVDSASNDSLRAYVTSSNERRWQGTLTIQFLHGAPPEYVSVKVVPDNDPTGGNTVTFCGSDARAAACGA